MHNIVKHIAGSHSYGTNIATSDMDVRGIFIADPVNILTPFFPVYEKDGNGEDEKYYELRNFMKLYCEGNPNILESLWVDEADIIDRTPGYNILRASAESLLSKKVAFTFSGYAVSQLNRIKGHNKWISNPQPVDRPKHKDFVKLVQWFGASPMLPSKFTLDFFDSVECHLVHYSNDIYGIAVAGHGAKLLDETGDFNVSAKQQPVDVRSRLQPIAIIKYCKEEYVKAVDTWKNYWQWKNNRNEKRSELEEKFGYDTKHAMHLVRLLRMGEEILTGKGVIVKRPDAKELLDIRDGLWDYDDLVKWATEKDEYIRGELYANSKLPKHPNITRAARVLMEVQRCEWEPDGLRIWE